MIPLAPKLPFLLRVHRRVKSSIVPTEMNDYAPHSWSNAAMTAPASDIALATTHSQLGGKCCEQLGEGFEATG